MFKKAPGNHDSIKWIRRTHAAVAPKISCRFAFVKIINAALNNSVKTRIVTIFVLLLSGTRKSKAVGINSRRTVTIVSITRTRMSIRSLL